MRKRSHFDKIDIPMELQDLFSKIGMQSGDDVWIGPCVIIPSKLERIDNGVG